jgi:hypothetical protein
MRTLIALLVGCLLSTSAFATAPSDSRAEARSAKAEDAWRQARIRPQDPRLADLLRAGVARSATFRAIVNRLEAGKMIVYVSLSPTMRSSLAGKLTWITEAGGFRYVRATINTEQSADQMIATLAHELQHALEVSDDLSVVDQRSLLGLYRRIGRPSYSGINAAWETVAAQQTGFQVRRELVASAAPAAGPAPVSHHAQS